MPKNPKFEQAECSSKCQSEADAYRLISVICRSGDIESLLYLATTGICNNVGKVTDSSGRSALHIASSVGKLKVVEWLIRFKNALVNVKDGESGYSSLHRAIFHGQLHVVKALISDFNANFQVQDFDGLTPLDHISIDRETLRKSYGHHFKRTGLEVSKCNAYLWGSNTNYNLGFGHHQAKATPELNEFFRKENVKISQVATSKFHSAFLSVDGAIFTCGHGRGGRLGHGHNESILSPKSIKSLSEFNVTSVSLGIDHSLFLTSNGQVFVCGMNDHGQLGLKENVTSTPVMLNNNKSKLPSAKGIAASKYHSLFWTEDEVYTWGLNAGQLGHRNHDKIITAPKLVSSLKGSKIKLLSSSDGAIVVLTSNNDILALNEYQTRKIASKVVNVVKIEATGGHLDHKALSSKSLLVDKGGQDLKVFVLNSIGKISVWQEKSPNMTLCLFNLPREIWIKDMAIHRTGLLLVSREGTAFVGTHHTRSLVRLEMK